MAGFAEGFNVGLGFHKMRAEQEQQRAQLDLARRRLDEETRKRIDDNAEKAFGVLEKQMDEIAKIGDVATFDRLAPAIRRNVELTPALQLAPNVMDRLDFLLQAKRAVTEQNSAEAVGKREATKAKAMIPVEAEKAGAVATAQKKVEQKFQGPQTDIGKQVEDRVRFVNQYGEGSPQVTAFDELATAKGAPSLGDVAGLRKEFTGLSKDFAIVKGAFQDISKATLDPSPAGDLALVFAYMKLLDPNSSVREGEFATAQNTAGIDQRISNMYNRLLSGERLNPQQRQDFTKQAENLFANRLQGQIALENQFGGIAERQGMPRGNVVVDFIGPFRPKGGAPSIEAGPVETWDLQTILKKLDDPNLTTQDRAKIDRRLKELEGAGRTPPAR